MRKYPLKQQIGNGAYTAIVTPMINGVVDEKSLVDLIEYQTKNGITGIVPCGTTGESATLSFKEQTQVVKLTIKTVAGRVPVIAGAGANSTAEAVKLTRAMKYFGADAVLSVTPYYNRPSQEGIYQHFKAVAGIGIPVVLYNVPTRTGVDMLPETVRRLAEITNIIGIKEAKDDINQIKELINTCPKDFLVFSGNDSLALPTVLAGGNGVVSVASNVIPDEITTMIEFALDACSVAGDVLHTKFLPLMEAMFCYPSPAPAKNALALMGIISSDSLRLPMTQIDEGSLNYLTSVMSGLKLLS